jgi:beta-galactosidase
MLLATQYYRPPFPDRTRWKADLSEISSAGFDAIYCWATWAWIEAIPGEYDFDDFDELFDKAAAVDLDVIVTSSAEIHPYWLHREIRDSRMVDHLGREVESSTLAYCHHGVCPGGCTDHPEVRERLGGFLEALSRRYADAANLRAWDCWNEFRWSVQSDGYVCFCPHTVAAFRNWLDAKYGSLDALCEAWRRRYSSWEDVHPGRQPGRGWTETIEFLQFLTWRAADNVRFRVARLRAADPNHDVIAHSVVLSSFMVGGESPYEQPLSRGNDWELAGHLDGFGASHFPAYFHTTLPEYGVRLESARSAAGPRPYWVCELQGGAARNGIMVLPGVSAARMRRWVWEACGRGAKAISFWCWRDEVFGREASGFGIVGDDGHAEERVEALTALTAVLREHGPVLDDYAPAQARVGVIFEPVNHQLEWAFDGAEGRQSAGSVLGYLLCLERLQMPYDVLAANHLPADLSPYRLLFLPWAMIVRPEVAEPLAAWIDLGGTLVAESELDAYTELGFYRYPRERPFARRLGIEGRGRRPLPADPNLEFAVAGDELSLRPAGWVEPLAAEGADVLARSGDDAIAIERRFGGGAVVSLGTHLGLAYRNERYEDFERFVRALIDRTGAGPDAELEGPDGEVVQWRFGSAGDRHVLFVVNEGSEAEATFRTALASGGEMLDLLTRRVVVADRDGDRLEYRLPLDEEGAHVFVF